MKLGIYIHPHDLLPDPAPALEELARLGFSEIALACAYHAGRWTRPRPGPLVVNLEDGVVHFRPRAASSPLAPRPSALVCACGPDPADRVLAAAAAAGLAVHAWAVCFHNTPLASAHPAFALRNAFGEAVAHALCPSHAEVRSHAAALASDLGVKRGLAALELEAAGFLGHAHASHHEKCSFALGRYDHFLLSLCFCPGCGAAYRRGGVDPERAAARVRELVQARLHGGDALESLPDPGGSGTEAERAALERDLGGMLPPILEARSAIVRAVLEQVRCVLPESVRLTAMVEPDPLHAGSQASLEPTEAAELLDGIVLTHYGQAAAARRRSWERMAPVAAAAPCTAAFWPRRADFAGLADLVAAAKECRALGAAAVRLYHYSLLPPRTLERAASALRELP